MMKMNWHRLDGGIRQAHRRANGIRYELVATDAGDWFVEGPNGNGPSGKSATLVQAQRDCMAAFEKMAEHTEVTPDAASHSTTACQP
jgi:hypothetical protein